MDLFISCDFNSTFDIEVGGAHFISPVFNARTNIGAGGLLYIIPADNQSYIYPSHFYTKLPEGDTMDCIILCSGYRLGDNELESDKVFGLRGRCIGKNNNYLVCPTFENGKPVAISNLELEEFSFSSV